MTFWFGVLTGAILLAAVEGILLLFVAAAAQSRTHDSMPPSPPARGSKCDAPWHHPLCDCR